MRNLLLAGCAAFTLAGCGGTIGVSMMPRDSGLVTRGTLVSNGSGSGSMTVIADGKNCSGPAARVASSQSFGFKTAYASNSRGATANAFASTLNDGDTLVKAILSCDGGGGLRCEITGRDGIGGGVCVSDSSRVFDILVSK